MSLRTEIQRIASENPETRKYLVPLLKKAVDPQVREMLRVFNNQHPYYRDLDFIASQRRTLIGNGYGELDGRKAGLLAKLGLVGIYEGRFGREVELTTKGIRLYNEGKEDFSLL